jgi:hypothetical protein
VSATHLFFVGRERPKPEGADFAVKKRPKPEGADFAVKKRPKPEAAVLKVKNLCGCSVGLKHNVFVRFDSSTTLS